MCVGARLRIAGKNELRTEIVIPDGPDVKQIPSHICAFNQTFDLAKLLMEVKATDSTIGERDLAWRVHLRGRIAQVASRVPLVHTRPLPSKAVLPQAREVRMQLRNLCAESRPMQIVLRLVERMPRERVVLALKALDLTPESIVFVAKFRGHAGSHAMLRFQTGRVTRYDAAFNTSSGRRDNRTPPLEFGFIA